MDTMRVDAATSPPATAVAHARETTRAFLEALRQTAVDPETADSVVLVVSELVTNALRHGGGTYTLRLTADPDLIEVAVDDPSPQAPRLRTPDLNGGTGGFGWPMVNRLARATAPRAATHHHADPRPAPTPPAAREDFALASLILFAASAAVGALLASHRSGHPSKPHPRRLYHTRITSAPGVPVRQNGPFAAADTVAGAVVNPSPDQAGNNDNGQPRTAPGTDKNALPACAPRQLPRCARRLPPRHHKRGRTLPARPQAVPAPSTGHTDRRRVANSGGERFVRRRYRAVIIG